MLKSDTILKNKDLFLGAAIQKQGDFKNQFFEAYKYKALENTLLDINKKFGF
jgi:hypothetical protein